MAQRPDDLTRLRNIGPTAAARLTAVGVRCRADLARLGAAAFYRRLVARAGGQTLPVCYYLYSLQGALDGVHWHDVDEAVKRDLLRAVGRDSKRRGLS